MTNVSVEKAAKPTEQDFELLSRAHDQFNARNYVNCLKTLEQIEESIGFNSKILHNKALVNFYKNSCRKYKEFSNILEWNINEIQCKNDCARNRNTTALYFNKAVILYHLRKPFAALNILKPVLDEFEDLDEPLASTAGLLMLQLLIMANQHKKAEIFLSVLENHFGLNSEILTNDEGTNAEVVHNANSFQRVFKILSLIIKLVNQRYVLIPDDGSVEFSVLKAHQYYIGKDFQMAAKQLSKKFSSESYVGALTHGEDQDTCIANNMGVIHLRVRHYAMAVKFFQHAFTFDNNITGDLNERSLFYVSATRKPEILYNMGVAMLHLQRPKEAFECFLVPLKIYHNNPRLWLRVAEACIMLREKEQKQSEKKHIISSLIGSGLHRKYILGPIPTTNIPIDGQSFAIPYPNFEFAALSLRNAISLVEKYKKMFSTNHVQENTAINEDTNYCNPSNQITKESFDRLVATIYAAYCYVCIRLGEYVTALEYAKLLLQLENLSDANATLGHLYCAEALVMLNRVREAQTYLDLKFIKNLNAHDFETKEWQINSIEAAQSVLRYNLVLTLVLQSEFEAAKALLATCAHPVVFNKFKMLKMYIELATGNVDNCKIMVRIDTPQYR